MFGHIFQNMRIYPSNQWISFNMIQWSWKNCRYDYINLRFNFSSNTYEVAVIRDDMLNLFASLLIVSPLNDCSSTLSIPVTHLAMESLTIVTFLFYNERKFHYFKHIYSNFTFLVFFSLSCPKNSLTSYCKQASTQIHLDLIGGTKIK